MGVPTTTTPKQGDTLTITLQKILLKMGGSASLSDNANRAAQKVLLATGTGGTGGGGIPEAPTDGKIYGRQNAAWAPVPNITYSHSAPSGGNPGDLWFQY